jgi:hypothetical protein
VGPRASLNAVAKRKISSPCRESKSVCRALRLVTILAELPRLTILRVAAQYLISSVLNFGGVPEAAGGTAELRLDVPSNPLHASAYPE